MQEQSFPKAAESTAFRVLLALGLSHLLNDTLQSVITAVYPLLKESMALSFVQIGFITLVYQISASVFQPLVGFYLDKKPNPWFLPIGMSFTLIGLVVLAFSGTLHQVLFSVFLVGIGSSILHPEASRLTSLASGGKRGLAQSVFQVGGNMGSSLGPLLAALCIAPYGQRNIVFFALLALCAIIVMIPICRWYKRKLKALRLNKDGMKTEVMSPLSRKKTIFSLSVLLILIFSKYVYLASITSYYTFFLIEKFDVTVRDSQFFLFAFLFASALGILLGGPVGDKVGRKYVIWASILGVAPFSLIMPHANLLWTCILSILIGLILSSAFSAILVYAQELLPSKLGLISGLFFGLAFGIAGIASAVLGGLADKFGIEYVYQLCAYMPLLGLIAWFLPDIRKIKK
ncbi:MFS transporter [Coprobacter fastidiosus]|uniref:FSR family fosmidomycin resistance protein-like MFS transporter n=1 Tax=Coprobacter fastidiosus NSB1 = JCM 33896 TaxID=1349822 RepID=A0A495VLF8_9BACT|nr:MFS transporter [Coprobacter fastidiosus]ERM88220.1 major facilitator transporter [Coprobacter fastidiosus NSB1 = JCM 33896]RKT50209.1 FSR family fosmidomycin resistance protein-like MFS transporter [Coprobacter fastidiosus NSB1 = JCM 33896]BEG62012.1 MFS transporter [Coprobacter fastidiosus]